MWVIKADNFDLYTLLVSSLTTLYLESGFPTWNLSYCDQGIFPWFVVTTQFGGKFCLFGEKL